MTTGPVAAILDAARPSIAARAGTWASNVLSALRNRRAFYKLGEMSDAELQDIGLTRGDLNVALDLPLTSDPTAHLGATARRLAQGRFGTSP